MANVPLRRAYDADTVDRYVATLHNEISDLRNQVAEAVRMAAEAEAKAASVAAAEALLGKALLTAQRAADETVADAERRARVILAEARQHADELMADVRAEAQRVIDEAHETVDAVFASLAPHRPPEAPAQPPAAAPGPAAPADAGGGGVRPMPPEAAVLGARAWWSSWRDEDDADDADAGRDGGFGGHGEPGAAAEHDGAVEPGENDGHDEPGGHDDEHDEPGGDHGGHAGPGGHDDEPVGGRILDLRPLRSNPARPDWGLPRSVDMLAGTGTDNRVPDLWLDPLPEPPAADTDAPRGSRDGLRERWRVARDGAAALDDDLLSRRSHLESLADGSYVEELRGWEAFVGAGRAEPDPDPLGSAAGRRRRWWRRQG